MTDALTFPDGSVYRFVERPEDPETGSLVMDFELRPDCVAPPPHVHPGGQTEVFECLEGWFELLVGREWRRLDAGQSLTVPPGTRHTFRNQSGAIVRIRNLHEPAHSFEVYLRRLHAIVTETGPRSPKLIAKFALLWRDHADTIAAADPPLRLGLPLVAGAARLLRVTVPPPTPR